MTEWPTYCISHSRESIARRTNDTGAEGNLCQQFLSAVSGLLHGEVNCKIVHRAENYPTRYSTEAAFLIPFSNILFLFTFNSCPILKYIPLLLHRPKIVI